MRLRHIILVLSLLAGMDEMLEMPVRPNPAAQSAANAVLDLFKAALEADACYLMNHAGDTFPGVCTSIFYKSDGVFGIMANVLATYVILFVLFGAFLEKSGAQRFFIDFPLAAVGHRIGGPAKVSVIASGLFGSISGSTMDIVKTFIVIIVGTYAYSWILSGIWIKRTVRLFAR